MTKLGDKEKQKKSPTVESKKKKIKEKIREYWKNNSNENI